MAAGLGFKTFTTGEVLTAADTNGYLMQGVLVFASAAARNAAITSPQEGQFAYTKDTNGLWYYDGAAWVASGATGDIEGVTVSSPITGGGTSGTVNIAIQDALTTQKGAVQLSDSTSTTSSILAATPTAVKSAYDLAAAAIPKTLTTTTGDTIYASSANTPARLGIGSTGQVLTVASGLPSWATPASGGGMTSIASGSLSGSSLDLTSISGSYNSLQLVLKNFYFDNAANMRITINNTGSIYTISDLNAVFSSAMSTADINITSGAVRENSSNVNEAVLDFPDYKNATTYKIITSKVISQNNTTPANHNLYNSNIWAASSAAITRITIYPSFGNFSGGTYILYGVK